MSGVTRSAGRLVVPLLVLVLAACTPPPSAAPTPNETQVATSAASPTASPPPASETPKLATATPVPTPSRIPLALPAVSVSCPIVRTVPVLALAKPIGAPDGVVGLFDARDPSAPKVVCALAIPGGRFVSATEIEYPRFPATGAEIVRRDLATGDERVTSPPGRVASGFGGLIYAWGRDGKTLVYLAPDETIPVTGCPCAGNSVHLVSSGTDRVLGYFGEIPARGFTAHAGDQVAVSFSPNGSKFVAVDTLSGSSKLAEAKSLRVYSLDGRPLLETNGTMPVWVGETLLFRGCRFESPACGKSWDGGPITTVLPAVQWDDPVASVGTQLVAFSRWDDTCLGCVVLYNAGANSIRSLEKLRSQPMWAAPTVIWWTEEERCEYPSCTAPAPTVPTERMDAYDLNTGAATALPFSFAYDVWPRG